MTAAFAARAFARRCSVAFATRWHAPAASGGNIRDLEIMGICINRRALAGALAAVIVATTFTFANAGSADYAFEPVENEVKQGATATLAVRLIDKRSGAPVPDAVIFATRMDMAPDAMEAMTTSVEPMPSDQPGVYRFKSNLMMAGGWRLSIAAKVQGEPDTVESRLVFKAVP